MILLTHIAIALASMVFTTYLYFFPSKGKLRGANVLVVLTLVSGTVLVFTTHANMLRTCMTGLVYLALVSIGIFAAKRKLAQESA